MGPRPVYSNPKPQGLQQPPSENGAPGAPVTTAGNPAVHIPPLKVVESNRELQAWDGQADRAHGRAKDPCASSVTNSGICILLMALEPWLWQGLILVSLSLGEEKKNPGVSLPFPSARGLL